MELHKQELSALISQYDKKIEEALEGLKKLQEENQAKLREELQKQINRTSGVIFHSQAFFMKQEKSYRDAVGSLIDAVTFQLAADDQRNLRRALRLLIECLQQLDKDMIKKTPKISNGIPRILKALSNQNTSGLYTDDIDALTVGFDEACAR